jgi:hypothetical protein
MKKSLLQCSLIGALIGYSIFHPLVMLLSYLMSSNAAILDTSKSLAIMDVIKKSFSAGMLPWSLSFAFFNGIIGLYYGSIKQANLAQKKLIADLQKARKL